MRLGEAGAVERSDTSLSGEGMKSSPDMQAFADVQAFVFDVFGTVVDWRTGVAREAAGFLSRYAPRADPAAFADAWRRRYSPAMEEVRSGRRPFARLDTLHRENLESTLPEFGIDPAAVPAAELDALNLAWRRLDAWPDSLAGLTTLRRRFIVAPLSNGNIRLMIDLAKRAGLPWDAILGAEITQAYKPTPEAYLRAVDVLMLKPEQVCLVAAHNDDLAAARLCGLRTAFVPRPTEHGPGQTTDLTAQQDWDAAASGIDELARLICG
jgi:2-haloacid dehalogenase